MSFRSRAAGQLRDQLSPGNPATLQAARSWLWKGGLFLLFPLMLQGEEKKKSKQAIEK